MHTFIHVKWFSFIYLFFNLCSSQVISQSVRQVFPEVGVSPGKRLKYKSYTGYPSSWQFIYCFGKKINKLMEKFEKKMNIDE